MSRDANDLDALLRATLGDAGCTAGEGILDAYVELEIAGEDPSLTYPEPRSTCGRARAAVPITTACWRPRVSSARSSSNKPSRPGALKPSLSARRARINLKARR